MSDAVYFTDRSPDDKNPFSHWLWTELEEKARSGSNVYVYFFGSKEISLPNHFSSRIQIRTALKKQSLLHLGPFIQSLIQSGATSLTLVEPQENKNLPWSLLLIPQLKQIGVNKAQLSTLLFSSKISKNFIFQTWTSQCDLLSYSHPHFVRPKFLKKLRVEPIKIDPRSFNATPHWSLESLENLSLIPGSLKDLQRPEAFKFFALNKLSQEPEHRFIFLGGIGDVSMSLKKDFVFGPLSAHFIFPEELTGAQIALSMFSGPNLLVEWVPSDSALAGLALRISMEKTRAALNETRVYGLL